VTVHDKILILAVATFRWFPDLLDDASVILRLRYFASGQVVVAELSILGCRWTELSLSTIAPFATLHKLESISGWPADCSSFSQQRVLCSGSLAFQCVSLEVAHLTDRSYHTSWKNAMKRPPSFQRPTPSSNNTYKDTMKYGRTLYAVHRR
jgi:hypothetical protein